MSAGVLSPLRKWWLVAAIGMTQCAAIAACVVGRVGRLDRFVITVNDVALSIERNGKVLISNLDLEEIPTEGRRAIWLLFRSGDSFSMPVQQRTRIRNLAVYSSTGKEPLYRYTGQDIKPPVWVTEGPETWRGLPNGELVCVPPARFVKFTPPGVSLSDYRLEFELTNPLTLSVRPVYVDDQNSVHFEYRPYWEGWWKVVRSADGKSEKVARARLVTPLLPLTRAFLGAVFDVYPHLLAAAAAVAAIALGIGRPMPAPTGKGRRISMRWTTGGTAAATALALAIGLLVAGPTRVVDWLIANVWLVSLAALILVPWFVLAFGKWQEEGRRTIGAQAVRFSGGAPWLWHALVAAVIIGVAAAMAWVTSDILDRVPHNQDAVAQLFHSRMLAMGRLTMPDSEHLKHGHFHFDFMIRKDGRWFSQYPPGHLVSLAVGTLIGAPWLMPGVLSAGMLLMLYLLGVRLDTPGTGLLAVVLTASSPFFQMMHGTFMNHTTAGFLWAAALVLFVVGVQKTSRLAFLGCGLAVGMHLATRPFSAVACALPLAVTALVWALWRERKRRLVGVLFGLAGFLSMLTLMLLFNVRTTGHPLIFGYELTGSAWLGFDAEKHPFAEGVQHALYRLWILRRTLFEWPAGLAFAPILALFLTGRASRWDYLLLGTCFSIFCAFLADPRLLPMFGPRYWHEMLPVLCYLSARGIMEAVRLARALVERWARGVLPRKAIRAGLYAATACLLAGFTAFMINGFWFGRGPNQHRVHPWVVRTLGELRNWGGANRDLERAVAHAGIHNALVFVDMRQTHLYWSAFALNWPTLDTDVVYPRSIDEEKDRWLLGLYPDRAAYYAEPTPDGWKLRPYLVSAETAGDEHRSALR